MKKITLFACCFTTVVLTQAQSPILTAANSNPVSGESFTGININYTNPGSAGANQTWDFSAITPGSVTTFSMVAAAGTAQAASFPNASVATYNSANPGYYNYYSASSAALSIEGYAYGSPSNLVIPYSDPQMILSYPFTMGSTFVDPYYSAYASGSSTIIRKGTNTVTADGYGTLILPGGTLNNVLRVAVIDDYADTTSTGSPYAKYTLTSYYWYLPGTHFQVMSLTSLNSNGGAPLAQFGSYLDPTTLGNIESISSGTRLNIYPNPVIDLFTIEIDNNNLIGGNYILADANGREILVGKLNSEKTSVDMSHLAIGIYILKAGGHIFKIVK